MDSSSSSLREPTIGTGATLTKDAGATLDVGSGFNTRMLVIEDQKYFDEVVTFAKENGLYEANGANNDRLKSRLDYLAGYAGKNNDGTDKTRVRLFKDFAPYSFAFVIESKNNNGEWSTWFQGGLLFHGAHDGNGSGAAPTLAVTLTPVVGWAVHT